MFLNVDYIKLFYKKLIGAPVPPPFDTSKCYSLQVDESIGLPETGLDFQLTDAFTLSVDIKTTRTAGDVALANSNGSSNGWIFSNTAFGRMQFGFLSNGGSGYMISRAEVMNYNDGNWHTITISYDGSQSWTGTKWYIDGVSADSGIGADVGVYGSVSYSASIPIIGAVGNTAGFSRGIFWNGFLDNVAVISGVISPVNAALLHTQKDYSLNPDYANFLRWHRCGEVDIQIPFISVDSKNGLNGTPLNMTYADNVVPV